MPAGGLQTQFQSPSTGLADEVNRLISKDKIKAALSRAKFHHKRLGTAESEMVLVDAYVARIREMMIKGFTVECQNIAEIGSEAASLPGSSFS